MKTILPFSRLFLFFFFMFFSYAIGAQTLKNNGIYRISSYLVQRALSPVNSTTVSGQPIVFYSKTTSNAQCWRAILDNTGQYYTFTNLGTERVINAGAIGPNTELSQAGTGSPNSKWTVEPVTGYANCYYLSNSKLDVNGQKLYIQIPAGSTSSPEGTTAKIDVLFSDKSNELNRIWLFEEMSENPNAPSAESFEDIFQSWKRVYYKPHFAGGYVLGAPGFWSVAEMMEILLDAYEVTGHTEYKTMFYNVYTNFYKTQGDRNGNWMNNPYNDDLAWIIIACSRACVLFRDNSFLTIAKFHFDRMYTRALLPTGGLRWKEGNGDGSNSCINGPAQVAACYLGNLTGDISYFEKAKGIYDYQYRVLYDKNTGGVFDSALGETVTNNWRSTYNQGTFLGANMMLYEYYKDPKYLTEAGKVAAYTRGAMYNSNVMNNESGRDLDGFKGILMRYLRKYIIDYYQPIYIQWLHLNAKTAYNNRNSSGIISTLWGTKTPETSQDVFAASTAVSLIVNTPINTNLRKNAFQTIEAEDFDYISGPVAEPCVEGTENLGGIQNNYYTGYMNVDFGTLSASEIELRLSSIAEGGSIEIRLGSPSGTLIGTVAIPNSNNWSTYITVNAPIEPTSGMQKIYLVFKGTGYVANLNWFKFKESQTSVKRTSSNSFNIYPNIIKRGEKLNLKDTEEGFYTIISLNGSVVSDGKVNAGNQISTSELNPGFYFIKLKNGNIVRQSSFVIK